MMFKKFSGVITRSPFAASLVRTNFLNRAINPLLRRGLASKTIYVANVSFNSTEQGLEELGSKFGKVESVRMPRDYEGRSRGYGFIEYSQEEEAVKAMDGLNGIEFEGRELRVAEARGPNTYDSPRGGPRGGFGGGRGGFGSGFGGGRYGNNSGGGGGGRGGNWEERRPRYDDDQ